MLDPSFDVLLQSVARAPSGDDLPAVITNRATNRRSYDGRRLTAELVDRLRSALPPLGGVDTRLIANRSRIHEVAEIVGRCDQTLYSEPAMRAAFLRNVRFV